LDEVISKPNWTWPSVTLPNQPRAWIHLRTARMSTVAELVLPCRTNENTWLEPLEPLKTSQVWPPTVTLVCLVPSGPTAPVWFIESMIAKALCGHELSWAVSSAPLPGTRALNVLRRLCSELRLGPPAFVMLGSDFTPPVLGWLAHTPQFVIELAQIVCGPAP